MADVEQVWKQALPIVIQQVSGRGVWAALNAVKPILFDDKVYVVGLTANDSELAGHLRLPATKRLLDLAVTKILGEPFTVRVIDGITSADYDVVKRRDAERRRLQEAELTKMRAEMSAKTSWDAVYEQLARRFAAVTNKSLPQNKARFFEEAVALIAEARQSQAQWDEIGERNFARCLERLAQYVEMPSTYIAIQVLQKAGEL
jgi:hypothetical protein